MGYVMAMSPCVRCGRIFSCNPMRVPSIRVHGHKEPVCQDCFARLNQVRIAHGLEPVALLPDAYDACDEGELE
jgi:hypothetical protein